MSKFENYVSAGICNNWIKTDWDKKKFNIDDDA